MVVVVGTGIDRFDAIGEVVVATAAAIDWGGCDDWGDGAAGAVEVADNDDAVADDVAAAPEMITVPVASSVLVATGPPVVVVAAVSPELVDVAPVGDNPLPGTEPSGAEESVGVNICDEVGVVLVAIGIEVEAGAGAADGAVELAVDAIADDVASGDVDVGTILEVEVDADKYVPVASVIDTLPPEEAGVEVEAGGEAVLDMGVEEAGAGMGG